MEDQVELLGINQALRDGCRLHAFLSDDELRVIRIKKGEELLGFGKHPQAEGALAHANEDWGAGHRPYAEVYGDSGTKMHYLTRSSTASSPLDCWLLAGRTFDAWGLVSGVVVFQLSGLDRVTLPEDILDEVLRTGQPATWDHRGYTYHIVPSNFPNGEQCVSIKVVSCPEGKESGDADSWMYHITKTGQGPDLWSAMENAFESPEVEVEQE